jgi:DNA-binding transcriptional MerR regulator
MATKLLTTKQVSQMTEVPVGTLRCWRAQGKGPAFYRLEGTVRYNLDEVELWLKSNRHIPSVRQFVEERHVAL